MKLFEGILGATVQRADEINMPPKNSKKALIDSTGYDSGRGSARAESDNHQCR